MATCRIGESPVFSLASQQRFMATADAELKDPVRGRDYVAGIDSQRKMEVEYLTSFQVCTAGVDPQQVAQRLAGLRADELKAGVSGQFYNSEVMEAAVCVSNSLILDQGEFALAGNERLREYVSGLRQIGGESVSGFALSGDLGIQEKPKGDKFFVVKAPRNVLDADELIHECMVGFYGTNPLRRQIPNFSYIYGMFRCSPPFIDTSEEGKKEVVAWCNSQTQGQVSYVIYENIANATSFTSMSETASPEKFMKSYLQTMLALRHGFNTVGFTHYDLHGDNVLDRKVSEETFDLPYPTEGGVEYIESDGTIATIIDYGMSHIQLQPANSPGRVLHFGHVSSSGPLTAFGIYRDRPNVIHDAYKLFCMCLYTMLSPSRTATRQQLETGTASMRNPVTFTALAPLLSFFNPCEDPARLIAEQKSTFYFTPWTPQIASLSLDSWINHCRQYLVSIGITDPIRSTPRPGVKVLRCDGACLSFSQSLDAAGLQLALGIPTPTTFLEFYDSFGSLASREKYATQDNDLKTVELARQMAQELADRFQRQYQAGDRTQSQFQIAYEFEKTRLEKLERSMQPFIIYRLPNRYQDLLNPDVLRQVKNSVTNIAKFLDAYQRMRLSVKAMYYIQTIYRAPPEHPLSQLLAKYLNVLNQADQFRSVTVQSVRTDLNYLEPWRGGATGPGLQEVRQFYDMVMSDPRYGPYRWYWSTYSSLASML